MAGQSARDGAAAAVFIRGTAQKSAHLSSRVFPVFFCSFLAAFLLGLWKRQKVAAGQLDDDDRATHDDDDNDDLTTGDDYNDDDYN